MSSLFTVLDVSGSALDAQSKRMNMIASNLANAESATSSTGEPYKARQVVFAALPVDPKQPHVMGVRVTAIVEDQSPPRLRYEPGNPLADAKGFVTLPNVNLPEQMADMISASRSYQASIEVTNTTKQMIQQAIRMI